MSEQLTIKGLREGLLVTLGGGDDWPVATQALLTRIDQSGDFFKSAKLALSVGARPLTAADLGRLRDTLSERNVSLWAVLSDSPTTLNAAQALGLVISLPSSTPQTRPDPEVDPEEARDTAVMLRRTLRSGRSVRHAGHVVVVGDVNPGAEIVAGGDVVVWGRLRGVVHAGVDGDRSAIICALDFDPTQLRIANIINSSPPRKIELKSKDELKRKAEPRPEIASVENGQIVVRPWSPPKNK